VFVYEKLVALLFYKVECRGGATPVPILATAYLYTNDWRCVSLMSGTCKHKWTCKFSIHYDLYARWRSICTRISCRKAVGKSIVDVQLRHEIPSQLKCKCCSVSVLQVLIHFRKLVKCRVNSRTM
jgi:hypothetical protein